MQLAESLGHADIVAVLAEAARQEAAAKGEDAAPSQPTCGAANG
jgi:hypothetical protein